MDPAFGAASARPPVRPTQRVSTAGSISKNPWRQDPDISWYGPGFYGHRTACGVALTQTLVGVAHRTLPCGTLVTFRSNGVTVTVPVVDRGPYVAGRTWDLTPVPARSCITASRAPSNGRWPEASAAWFAHEAA